MNLLDYHYHKTVVPQLERERMDYALKLERERMERARKLELDTQRRLEFEQRQDLQQLFPQQGESVMPAYKLDPRQRLPSTTADFGTLGYQTATAPRAGWGVSRSGWGVDNSVFSPGQSSTARPVGNESRFLSPALSSEFVVPQQKEDALATAFNAAQMQRQLGLSDSLANTAENINRRNQALGGAGGQDQLGRERLAAGIAKAQADTATAGMDRQVAQDRRTTAGLSAVAQDQANIERERANEMLARQTQGIVPNIIAGRRAGADMQAAQGDFNAQVFNRRDPALEASALDTSNEATTALQGLLSASPNLGLKSTAQDLPSLDQISVLRALENNPELRQLLERYRGGQNTTATSTGSLLTPGSITNAVRSPGRTGIFMPRR